MHNDYIGHMLEQVLDKMQEVHELVAEVPKMAHKLEHIEQDVAELKRDMKQHTSQPTHVAHGHA